MGTAAWARAALVMIVSTPILVMVAPRSSGAATTAAPQVRVDQIGYPSTSAKTAYLMSAAPCSGSTFSVRTTGGTLVYTGTAGSSQGKWNAKYKYVCPLSFDAVSGPGTYTVVAGSGTTANSPVFSIAPASSLWTTGLANSVSFYEAEQDGADYVPSALRTAPAHLNDATAAAYLTPTMNQSGGFRGDLTPTGATVDASGGWWDAGDYLKFVQTTSYTVDMLGVGVRSFAHQMGAGAGGADMTAEFRFGVDWLEHMWDDPGRTLYYQVGIATGNASTLGDHDVWRLPQADDTYGGTNPTTRYIRHRPVLEAGPPGDADQPQSGRSPGGGLRAVCPGVRGIRPGLRGDVPGRRRARLRPGRYQPERPAVDHRPVRLLPRDPVARRSRVGRHRVGARPARRPGPVGVSGRRRVVGRGLPGVIRQGHTEPL